MSEPENPFTNLPGFKETICLLYTSRTLADALYRRANWHWAQNQGATLTHGWKPESGFLPFRWQGYDEALLLYMLALGSPTYPLSDGSYAA